jgi:hypothetical protein
MTSKNNLIQLYDEIYNIIKPLIDSNKLYQPINIALKAISLKIQNNKHYNRLPNRRRIAEIDKLNNDAYFLCECGVYIKKAPDDKYGKKHILTKKHQTLNRNKRIVYFKKDKYIIPEIEREVRLDNFLFTHNRKVRFSLL